MSFSSWLRRVFAKFLPKPTPAPVIEPTPSVTECVLAITVTNEAGDILPNASITLVTDANPNGPTTTTDENGIGYVTVSTPAELDATVSKESFTTVMQHVSIPSNTIQQSLSIVITAIVLNKIPEYRGQVKYNGKQLYDDNGPWLARGCSLFWGLWAQKYDLDKLKKNLDSLTTAGGVDYLRIFCEVGGHPAWIDRSITPKPLADAWEDYDEQFISFMKLCKTYHLRVALTIFASGNRWNVNDREAFVKHIVQLVQNNDLDDVISYWEIANEAYQNGFPGDEGATELRKLGSLVQKMVGSDVPVTITACSDDEVSVKAVYSNPVTNLATHHFSRTVDATEGHWRPVRQPWGWPGEYGVNIKAIDNERIGPYSSVASEMDPLHVVAASIVAFICGCPASLYHTGTGVYGGGASAAKAGSPANMWEIPNANIIHQGLQAIVNYMPSSVPSWDRERANQSWSPFKGDNYWAGSDSVGDYGMVRCYGAVEPGGNRFITAIIGIKNQTTLTARRGLSCDVRDALTGEILQHYDCAAGNTITLPDGAHGGSEFRVITGTFK